MRTIRFFSSLIAGAALLMLGGCSVGPSRVVVIDPPMAVYVPRPVPRAVFVPVAPPSPVWLHGPAHHDVPVVRVEPPRHGGWGGSREHRSGYWGEPWRR